MTGVFPMRLRTFRTEQWLPRPIDEVFAFFSDAHNLDELTPPWLHFRILTPRPIPMRQGAVIEYRIAWRWIPLRWRTEISAWEPPVRFVDRQVSGPYRRWSHEHTFEPKDGGTLMRDVVEYALPGWVLEPLVDAWVVGPDVRRIFGYREVRMRERFGTRERPLE
jgi:ligand-binding SRPBCC domain-containing protein